MQTRREFLKMTGLALGGVILSSCGTSGTSSGKPAPNGYRFYRLINCGDALPGGVTITDLPGSAMISSNNTVFFHAKDSGGSLGCYELSLEYGGAAPVVSGIRKVVRVGDTLNDGNVVSRLTAGDINRAGSYATVLRLAPGVDYAGKVAYLSGLYLDSNKSGLQRVLGSFDATSGVDGFWGQHMGDVDLHNNNDILISSHFSNRIKNRPQAGLFHIPGAAGSASTLVASSEDLISGADGMVRSFGLIDRNDGGYYISQALIEVPQSVSSAVAHTANTKPVRATALLMGRISESRPSSLHAASAQLPVSKAAAATTGDIYMGPRLGTTQDVAYIAHTSGDDMALYYDNTQVITSGGLSPRGYSIVSISPAVVGDDGLVYFSVHTDAGAELCIFNGNRVISVLGSGDIIPYDNYKTITGFMFGAMNMQLDTKGRIVFTGDYSSASGETGAVILGLPV